MKKNGFTLIELLGVIIILGLLVVLVFPSIINSIRNSSKKTDDLTLELIYNAADLYIDNHKNEFYKNNGNQYSINLKDLVDEGLLVSPIKLSESDEDLTSKKCIQVTYNDGFDYELKDTETCNVFAINVTLPKGLTPVKYIENGIWEIADTNEKWYDYNNQEWANAVILDEGVSKTPGTKIYPITASGKVQNIKAMFVYIPRYSYTIGNTYGVQLAGGSTPSQSTPGGIDIKFVSIGAKENGEAKYTGSSPREWYTHPAFTFGDEELEGIWVGKFELSHTTLSASTTGNNLNCSSDSCEGTIVDNLRILPGVASLRYNNVSNFFYAIKLMSRSGNGFGIKGNTHMIKNSEWGAVAYLSQSKYGKYGNPNYEGADKEVYQNKSSNYITGSSNGTPSTNTYRDSSGGQTATEEITVQCTYMNPTNNCGIGASTTGNITGIYDMSGGSIESVMGYLTTASENWGASYGQNSGFASQPDGKYFNGYTEFGKNDKGHALSEIIIEETAWNNDFSAFINDSFPWLRRSGAYFAGPEGGVFSFAYHNGTSFDECSSSRVVFVQPK